MSIRRIILLALLVVPVSGCAHTFSKEALSRVDPGLGFSELREAGEKHVGKTVLLGGVVVRSEVTSAGSLLEIYQTGLDLSGRPVDLDFSGGRFLAFYGGFLDPEIFRQGRRVSLIGQVEGERTRKLDEIEYRYPYLKVEELHLWEEEKAAPAHLPPPWHWYPGYPFSPWYRWDSPYYRNW